jgi:signal transduction histidine kinase/HPt (histidine-containing phosphotransfer) domain-containing protein
MSAPHKVLIVEDEAIIALDIHSHLIHLGFEIAGTASSAAEAFELIESNRPDIALMDIRIDGDMDGITAAGMIRERYRLPVIYLTAHADEATLERAEATEPFGYIVKPLQHNKLKAVITMALRRHKTERELEQSRALLSAALEELAAAKRSAEAGSRAKSDFLARMSHEIRTPMNLIMGMNALLLESPLNEKQKQHVEISYRNVRRLLRLINGILDLSKVEAGELSLESAPFDLHEVLKECSATIQAAIERKNLELQIYTDLSAQRYWLGDAERLQQVLLNLIGNSIKFTESGKIEVRVGAQLGENDQKGLRFEVTDTGCGIPREKAAMIFEAFQQGDGSINRPFEGTGLGLTIARTLVERMGGKIWVEPMSVPGAKFVFTVFLPTATEADFLKKTLVASTGVMARVVKEGTRILLVEDNPENVALMLAYLENCSVSVDVAENGVEAVAKRQKNEYDVVLMDVQMPIMDGYTATRAIRAWEKACNVRRTPILAVTAHALNGAAAASLEAGCDAHLTKPLERNDLFEAITKFANQPVTRTQSLPDMILARRPAFLANRQLDLEKMRTALAAQEFAVIQKIAHNCKGVGSGYGFPPISEIGASLEKAARAQDAELLRKLMGDFESYLGLALQEVAA